jgi:nitrite reductase/ring-hydroxylating ferredoxin subunit
MSVRLRVAAVSDVPVGECRPVDCAGRTIVLCNINGTLHAVSDTCAHNGGPLADGELEGHFIVCPWHAWRYDVRTGELDINPNVRIETFPTEVCGDEVFVTCSSDDKRG